MISSLKAIIVNDGSSSSFFIFREMPIYELFLGIFSMFTWRRFSMLMLMLMYCKTNCIIFSSSPQITFGHWSAQPTLLCFCFAYKGQTSRADVAGVFPTQIMQQKPKLEKKSISLKFFKDKM